VITYGSLNRLTAECTWCGGQHELSKSF